MNAESRPVFTQVRRYAREIPAMLVVTVLLAVVTVLTLAPAPSSFSHISIWFALCGIFFLPGYLAQKILFPRAPVFSLTDVPVAFVFSLALWCIPAAVCRLLRTDWNWFHALFLVILWALGITYLVRSLRLEPRPVVSLSPSLMIVPSAIVALALGAAWISALWERSSDDWSYLVVIQYLRTHPVFELDFLNSARDQLRFAIQTPVLLEAFAMRMSGYDPVSLVRDLLPPLFVPVAVLALYGWAQEFSGKAWVGLVAVTFQLAVFLVVGVYTAVWGSWFFGRIAQDKFVTWLLILPVVLLFFWRFMRDGHKADLTAYVLAMGAIVTVHPVGLAIASLAIGGFALFNLVQPARLPLRRWLVSLGWILPAVAVAVIFRLLTPASYFSQTAIHDPAVASYVSLSDARLVFLPPNFYFAHPHLIMEPLIVLALGLVVLLAGRLRTDTRAQFLWGSTLVPLALLYTPWGAWTLGQLVMPWELWRLMWVLPVGLIAGDVALWLVESKPWSKKRAWMVWGFPGIVVVAAFFFGPVDINQPVRVRQRTSDVSADAQDLLRSLERYVTQPRLVLAPLEWQQRMPAYALKAQPATTVSMTAGAQSDQDVSSFYASALYTDRVVTLIANPRIGFIVLPRASYLNEQLKAQPEFYARVYSNAGYTLYRVIRAPEHTLITHGMKNLEQKQWRIARKKFERARAHYGENALVALGLGWAEQALDHPAQAEAEYQQALRLAPDLRIAHWKLAELYRTQRRESEAVQQDALAK